MSPTTVVASRIVKLYTQREASFVGEGVSDTLTNEDIVPTDDFQQ